MARPPAGTPSARERIVDVASALFYERGIHQVGIDELVDRSGVARMTLYHHFASKSAVVRAVVERRIADRAAELDRALAARRTPRGKLTALFDVLEETVRRPGYRGCAFINAAVDRADPGDIAHTLVAGAKRAFAMRVEAFASEAGIRHAARFGMQCLLLWDGAAVESYLQGTATPVRDARLAALALMDAATAT